METIKIARIAHEANRVYCKTIGDDSQASWANAPSWQTCSAIEGVEFIKNNPDAKPSHSHESWLKDKEAHGWKYGPVKDEKKKEHPCCVPYEELPEKEKKKDYLFQAVVRALL